MNLRLSEAIRLGAMPRPQAFGGLFLYGGSCAIGAAMEASGIAPFEEGRRYVGARSGDAEELDRRFPILGAIDGSLGDKNDNLHWTREQIADWVEGIENSTERPDQPEGQLEVVSPEVMA